MSEIKEKSVEELNQANTAVVEELIEDLQEAIKPSRAKKKEPVAIERDPELVQRDLLRMAYEKLTVPIPAEYLVEYEQDGKKFTGYHAQYAINLLSKVFGFGNWSTSEEIIKQELINKSWAVVMKVTIYYGKNLSRHQFTTGYGAAYARSIENAFKAAKTNGFKNACRYMSIGSELYLKGFEDDITYVPATEPEATVQEEVISLTEQAQDIQNRIREATNPEQLASLKEMIEAVEGASMKATLVKLYNDKMITLMK